LLIENSFDGFGGIGYRIELCCCHILDVRDER
jgi:hypothetical protein